MDFITDFFLSKVIILAIALIAAFLAFLVYRDNPKGKINNLYLLMTLLMICWVIFAYIPRVFGKENYILGLASLKVAWLVTPPFFSLLYLLTIYLINKQKEYSALTKIILALGIIWGFINGFTNWVIADYVSVGRIVRIIYGPLMLPFLGLIAFIMGATVWPILKERFLLRNKKLQVFLTGLFTFYFLNAVFNISLPLFFDISRFYFLGDYSTLILLGFTTYATIQHRLFDARIILTEAVAVFVITILLTWTLASETLSQALTQGIMLVLVSWGSYLLVKSIKREIAQREQLQVLTQQLQAANEKLKELDDLKDEFISIAAHDLNTPIAAIEGYLSMIVDENIAPIENPKAREYIGRVYESSKRLANLVADLLNVSRIEQGRLIITREPLSLEVLAEKIAKEWEKKGEEQKLKLIFEKPLQPLPQIYADPDRLSQVVTNLVSNAIKFSEKEGGEVRVKLKESGSWVLLQVSDQGLGMSKEDLSHLFEKFYRVASHTAKGITGTGLGLYISKGIVELHGGQIAVASVEDKGSTFQVALPSATKEQIAQGKEKIVTPASQKVAKTEVRILAKAAREKATKSEPETNGSLPQKPEGGI